MYANNLKNNDFILLSPNDNCEQAQTLQVSEGQECTTSFTSNFQGATASQLPNSCGGTPNNDIWFEFTAISSVHVISIDNIIGSTPLISGAIYVNSCGDLEQIQCISSTGDNTISNLIVGETYKIRLFSMVNQLNTITSFDICITTLSPPIAVSIDYTNEQMLSEISGEGCIIISNIISKSGLDHPFMDQYPANSVEGIGFFTKNNSLFPLEKGIVLSTGNVLNAPGPKTTQDQSSGSTFWQGDDSLNDLINELGIGGETLHASSLEFDFVSETNYFAIDYLFASDEYGNRCSNHDLVAFFLTDTETGETINIAKVPNTNDIISVITIRDGQYQQSPINCDSNNIDYFDNYYDGVSAESLSAPINFRGHTTVMKAQANIIPNRTYHLKMVIAEQKTGFVAGPGGGVIYYDPYDTAVFISNITSVPNQVDLGNDMLIEELSALCEGEQALLDTQLDPEKFTFEWYKDDVLVEGETGATLTVIESGEYRIEAYYEGSVSCSISDSVIIEVYPIIVLEEDLANISVCVIPERKLELDITIYEPEFEQYKVDDVDFEYSYHLSESNAKNDVSAIENPAAYVLETIPSTIYIRVYNTLTECVQVFKFDIVSKPIIDFTPHNDIPICVYPDYFNTTDLTQVEGFFRDQTTAPIVFEGYYLNQEDAYDLDNPITGALTDFLISELPTTIYIAILNEETGCYSFTSFNIVETEKLYPQLIEDIVICDGYLLPELPAGQYYSTEEFGNGVKIQAGEILGEGSHTLYINIENEIGCLFSHRFEINIIKCIPQRGISPNGDGLNDSFNLTDYHVLQLQIFNRYGTEVYHHGAGYTNQWKGESNNKNVLPGGTYYYHFVTPTGIKTGYIQLIRELN